MPADVTTQKPQEATLKDHNLHYNLRFGFRKDYSTETALIRLIDKLLLDLDRNCIVDYQEAFDLIDHKILLAKLRLVVSAQENVPQDRNGQECFLCVRGTNEFRPRAHKRN